MRKHILFFVGAIAVLSSACKKTVSQSKVDDDIIQKYITDKNLPAIKTGTGLYYIIDVPGSGTQPNEQATVKVAYRGCLTNGSTFDQSTAAGTTFSLNSVIQGWQQGIPYFKEGGSGTLIIPSKLGYGSQAQSGIPANSVLVFDVTLIDVL